MGTLLNVLVGMLIATISVITITNVAVFISEIIDLIKMGKR